MDMSELSYIIFLCLYHQSEQIKIFDDHHTQEKKGFTICTEISKMNSAIKSFHLRKKTP